MSQPVLPPVGAGAPGVDAMLRLILTSRVYDVCRETPLDPAPRLSRRLGNEVLLKREDLQPIFSYKLRGAYNRIAHLPPEERARGDMGADVELAGDSYADAQARCAQLAAEKGLTFIHPFDDPLVIAGQGTVGDEILRHRLGNVSAIFVPVGGGGLIAGIGSYVKALRPTVRVIGVEPYGADAMYQSLAAGRRVALESVDIFADGVAVREVGAITFPIVQTTVDEIVRVTNDEICAAIKDIFDDTRSIMEPAGALAVAGLRAWVERTGTV